MKVRDVQRMLKGMNPDYKVTMQVECRAGGLEQREVYWIEGSYSGPKPRVVFYPGRRVPEKARRLR